MSSITEEKIRKRQAELDRLRSENMTELGALFTGLGQGLTFGFSDEIAGGIAATFLAPFSDETFDEIYDRQVEEGIFGRENIRIGQEKHPVLSFAGELVGGLPTGLGMFKAGSTVLKNAPKLAKYAGIGAAEGAIYGAGVAGEGGTIEGAEKGATFGAALGPVGLGVGHVAGKLVDKVVLPVTRIATETPNTEAIRLIRDRLYADEIDVATAQRELDKLGPQAVLADLQGGVQGLAEVVATKGGRPRTLAGVVLEGRQRGQQQRVLENTGVDPNDIGTFRMNVHQLIKNRKTQAGPYYRRAYQTFIAPDTPRTIITSAVGKDGQLVEDTVTTSLTEILEIIPKRFHRKAKTFMEQDIAYLDELKRSFPDTPAGRRDALQAFRRGNTSGIRYYDHLKRALGNEIGIKVKAGAFAEVRNLENQQNRLLDYLDQASPDFRKAREIFAGERELSTAVEYGRSLMNNKVDLAEVELMVTE
jgi:hypothetical protein